MECQEDVNGLYVLRSCKFMPSCLETLKIKITQPKTDYQTYVSQPCTVIATYRLIQCHETRIHDSWTANSWIATMEFRPRRCSWTTLTSRGTQPYGLRTSIKLLYCYTLKAPMAPITHTLTIIVSLSRNVSQTKVVNIINDSYIRETTSHVFPSSYKSVFWTCCQVCQPLPLRSFPHFHRF